MAPLGRGQVVGIALGTVLGSIVVTVIAAWLFNLLRKKQKTTRLKPELSWYLHVQSTCCTNDDRSFNNCL